MEIVVLKTTGSFIATKKFSLLGDGTIQKKGYNSGTYFTNAKNEAKDIHELSKLLSALEGDSQRFIIRGAFHPDTDQAKTVRRRIHREGYDANEYPFQDTPNSWLMLDIDKLELPSDIDANIETEKTIEHVISLLPNEFHDVAVHWHLSSSAGMAKDNRFSIHLWYWMDKPLDSHTLKIWAKTVNHNAGYKLIDDALFNSVQIHYTANPIFSGGAIDPISNRSGLLKGHSDVVAIDLSITPSPGTALGTSSLTTSAITSHSAHGFDDILSNMGDHPGGDGFHEPLLRATSSIVSEKGDKWINDNMSDVITDIQSHIDDADQSHHSSAEITRYRSNANLSGLIRSAIDKGFGKKPILPPYFSRPPLSLVDAEKHLDTSIGLFISGVDGYNHRKSGGAKSLGAAPSLGIRAAAGLGKTTQIIEWGASKGIFQGSHIEYYVPNHTLSKQLLDDLKKALQDASDDLNERPIPVQAQIIKGRNGQSDSGEDYCKKKDLADRLAKQGYNVQLMLCEAKSTFEKCAHFDVCLYQKQFKSTGWPPGGKEGVYVPAINVLAHNHLFLSKRDALPKPDLVIIDESFYQTGIEKYEIPSLKLRHTGSTITEFIFDSLYKDLPLLQALRDKGITPTDLRTEARSVSTSKLSITITPVMKVSEQESAMATLVRPDHIDKLLDTLAEELEITVRDDSYAVELVKNTTTGNDLVLLHTRKEMNIPADVPVLFIDADLNSHIVNLYRPDTVVDEISVERLATVHQFNKTFSKSSLGKGALLHQVKAFIKAIASKGKTLVVASKQIRLEITAESGGTLIRSGTYEGASVVHFGNLRGLNDYEDYDNVIVVGREQPPGEAMETLAKALWWDENVPLQLLTEKSGSKPYESEERGYRMRDATPNKTRVQNHPDRRVQDLLELSRESECTQAVDRLRLVRARKGEQKQERQVFLLTSIPLDITVDHLWNWDMFQRTLELWEKSDGVLPLRPEHLMKCCPGHFKTERSAKKAAGEIKCTSLLMYIYISDRVHFHRYKVDSSSRGSASKALISSKHADPKKAVEGKLGEKINFFELDSK